MGGKTCTKCGETKPLDKFKAYDNGYGPKRKGSCKDCRNLAERGTRTESSAKYYYANVDKMRSNKKEYYYSNQDRLVEYSSQYYEDNKDVISLKLAARTYNISFEEAKAMRSAPCAICGTDGSHLKNGMHIDHCHTTGKVRGTLCLHCNVALGSIREDLDILEKMKEYINDHK